MLSLNLADGKTPTAPDPRIAQILSPVFKLVIAAVDLCPTRHTEVESL